MNDDKNQSLLRRVKILSEKRPPRKKLNKRASALN